MVRVLVVGIFVVLAAAVLMAGLPSEAPDAHAGVLTPTPSATATETPSPTASATATGTSTSTTSASASATATTAQPAAVPQTGGEPTNSPLSLALLIVLGTAGTAGLFAASYALTRRS